MERNMIQGAITGLVVGLLLVLLQSAAKRPATRDPVTGDLVLQLTPVLTWMMGGIAIGGPIFILVLSMIVRFKNPNEVYIPIAIGAFFLVVGGLTCLWGLRRRTRLGKDGLTSEYMIGRSQFLEWSDVIKLTRSGPELWLRGATGNKALLMLWFSGIAEAVLLLKEHRPESVQ